MNHDHVDTILDQWARERPDLDVSPMGIIGRMARLGHYIERDLQKNFARYGINSGDFDVLATLRRSGSPYQLTPTQLFSSLMLSSGAMTNRLDRLERAAFIERTPDPSDRRGTLVRLTTTGFELIEQIMTAHIALEHEIMQIFEPHERQQLADLLRKWLLFYGDGGK